MTTVPDINHFYIILGHYCPQGTHEEIRCEPGEYQDQTGQATCKVCVAGYYCDNTLGPVVMYNDTVCPSGLYIHVLVKYESFP